MSRKRLLALIAAFAALALVLAACEADDDPDVADDADPEEGITWAVTGADQDIHQEVVDLWNEENPDTPLDVVFLPDTADEQRQEMFQDLTTGTGEFDVLGLDVIWTGEFGANDFLVNLEDQRDAVEGVSLPGAIESSEWQGELWAMPYSSNFGLLYYRSDLIDEAPETWDELFEVALEVSEAEGVEGYVGQGESYEGFVVNYLEYFWSAGGEVFNEDQSEVILMEGDAAERALDFMTEAQEQGVYAPGFNTMVEDDARTVFQGGDAVFMRNWPYAYPLLSDEEDSEVAGNFDIAPLPTFDGDGTISALGGLNNAVSAFSDNPGLATEFVVWAASNEEAQMILGEESLPPTMLSVYDELEDAGDPVFEILPDIAADARARPPVPGYNGLSLAMQDNLHPAYNSQQDADSAFAAVVEAAEGALEDVGDPEAEL